MLRTVTIEPTEKYFFDVGNGTEVLILREATKSITLSGDDIAPVEISKCDVVTMIKYRGKALYFQNQHTESVTIEFQLSDTMILIREQLSAISGNSLVIEEIVKAIQVSEIKAPIAIKGTVPVSLSSAIEIGEVAVSNTVHTKQSITGQLIHTQKLTASNGRFTPPNGAFIRSMTIQAGLQNTDNVFVFGFELPKGAVMKFDYPYLGALNIELTGTNEINGIFLTEAV